ncbi:MAG: hypothetical protein KDA89_24030, partial [Planctomycetaceae bacterium]|nr:hypothetical protein [Planctomycetaceae bacterium]
AYENPVPREVPASFRLILKINELITLVQGAEAANKQEREEKIAEDIVAGTEAAEKPKQGAELRPAGRGNERLERMRQRREENGRLMREALAEGHDEIRIEARPTDNGVRMRARLDEGFIRGLGRIVGSRFLEP